VSAARGWALVAIVATTASACDGGGLDDGESQVLDIEVASQADGLRATTSVGGDEIAIEARTVGAGSGDASADYRAERLVATVTGADGVSYADWQLHVATDELDGTLAGMPLAGTLSDSGRAGIDWAALASSRAGGILTAVSERAAATAASGAFPEVERELILISEIGATLQLLPSIIEPLEPVCGDRQCTGDETDANCPEDCGCAAMTECGGVAPFGCFCSDDCAANGDCCIDSCVSCQAGCPPCGERTPCDSACTTIANVCDGQPQCAAGEDEAVCSGGACRAGQIACDDGSCREYFQFCDGIRDCPGGEDELCECAYCTPG
jgi:hypothetical protein